MKKINMFLLVLTFILALSISAFANDLNEVNYDDTVADGAMSRPVSSEDNFREPVVGDDIEIGEGEFKIISFEPNESIVGDDIEIGEGEFRIISFDPNENVVGDDIEIGDGEVKIVSIEVDESVVGDDIEIEEGEFKIISYNPQTNDSNTYIYYGIAAVITLLAAFVIVKKKKTIKTTK